MNLGSNDFPPIPLFHRRVRLFVIAVSANSWSSKLWLVRGRRRPLYAYWFLPGAMKMPEKHGRRKPWSQTDWLRKLPEQLNVWCWSVVRLGLYQAPPDSSLTKLILNLFFWLTKGDKDALVTRHPHKTVFLATTSKAAGHDQNSGSLPSNWGKLCSFMFIS